MYVSEEASAIVPQNVLKAEQLFYHLLAFLLDHQLFTQAGASQMAISSDYKQLKEEESPTIFPAIKMCYPRTILRILYTLCL